MTYESTQFDDIVSIPDMAIQSTLSVNPHFYSQYSDYCYDRHSILDRIKELHRFSEDSYQYGIYMKGVMDVIELLQPIKYHTEYRESPIKYDEPTTPDITNSDTNNDYDNDISIESEQNSNP